MKALLFLLACFCAAGAEWKQANGYRWRDLPRFEGKSAGFKILSSAETCVTFTNVVSELGIARNRILENGSGVALGDYDGDGLPDIFACGIDSGSRLYRNLGNWKFADQTAAAELPANLRNVRGAVFADINGDGSLDLLVTTVGEGVRCFINSSGKFVEMTDACGLRRPSGSTTLALADVDGNGTLDLYVANYRTNDIRDVGRISFKNVGGKPVIPPELQTRFTMRGGEIAELGEADQLYLNDGKGHFSAVSWTGGAFVDANGKTLVEPPRDWGLTATFRDVNNDGAPDLYVCNDYWTADRLWINDGKGHFRAVAPLTLRKIPSSSMGVDFADVNRDGILDFFVVEMLGSDARTRKRQAFADKPEWPTIGLNADLPQVFQNTLFIGRSDGSYAEAAYYAGVEASDWSWSPIFLDVDLDGYEDLLISAGHFRDVQDLDTRAEIQRRQHSWNGYTNEIARQAAYTKELMEHYRLYPSLQLPVHAYRNTGDLHFKPMYGEWGFSNAAVHHGMAVADLDGDGDLDLVVNCLNSGLEIYRNNCDSGRVAVRLKGASPNAQGIGAKIVLTDANGTQQKELFSGGSYLSGSEPMAVFALKPGQNATLEVTWRTGKKSKFADIEANRLYELAEPVEAPLLTKNKPIVSPLFEDVSDRIRHVHHEVAFDDYQRQPTLPFKLSQQGPSVLWFDLNGDGNDDLIIVEGAGAPPAVFHSDGKGEFKRADTPADWPATGDYQGLVGWRKNSGDNVVIAAISGYEVAQGKPVQALSAAGARAVDLPVNFRSASTLALGCFGSSTELALFVGGGVEPVRYPLAGPSALLRLENGEWKYDARNSALLSGVGLVNGAVWSDLDGDSISELVLACEWGPIRVFAVRKGLLVEVTSNWGLSDATGLWRGIATADVDGDGRMDIIAANWGLNSPWRASSEHPFTAVFGELSQPGRIEFLETEWDGVGSAPTAIRPLERLAGAMPFVMEQFRSAKEFAAASIDAMLGERKVLAKQVTAKTLASTVFLNRGGKFVSAPLPAEAQLAPAFSVNAADFDGDGNIDIFLSQNVIAMNSDYARCDAGRGLLLKGNGHGGFEPMSGSESGIKIYGEQRGAAICDFDGDSRPDLTVSQNGAQTKLYRNATGKSGVRVKLVGPAGNVAGIGAQIWVENGRTKSAVQEIQAGSGYLSSDSAIKVVPRLPGGHAIVRWAGGAITSANFPESGGEISIQAGDSAK